MCKPPPRAAIAPSVSGRGTRRYVCQVAIFLRNFVYPLRRAGRPAARLAPTPFPHYPLGMAARTLQEALSTLLGE